VSRWGEWEPIKIPLRNLAYILNLKPQSIFLKEGDENTNQWDRNDPHKDMNAAEKEWDQSNPRLGRYGQNSEQVSC
jgi:hypothetical protein